MAQMLGRLTQVLTVLLSLAAVTPASSVRAEATTESLLSLSGGVGFLGTASSTVDSGSDQVWLGNRDPEYGLPASVLLNAQYLARLHPVWAIGAMVGFHSYPGQVGNAIDPAPKVGFDLAMVAERRSAVSNRVELYSSVMVGLMLQLWNDATSPSVIYDGATFSGSPRYAVAHGHANPTPGYYFSSRVGVRVRLTESSGVFGEIGYVRRGYSPTVSYAPPAELGMNLPRFDGQPMTR
jgi:hypothetical protein